MKRLIVTRALVLSMIFTLGLASNAAAGGRAAALLAGTADGSVLVLIKFNETQFTQDEAQQLTTLLQFGGSVLTNLLKGSAPDVTVNLSVFDPVQMTSFGLGDADVANDFILTNFSSFTSIGVGLYIKVVAKKVEPPQGVTGQNIRLNLYIFSGSGSALTYVASLEVPKQLIDQFGSLLSYM
jgi:hypothetical protein